MILGGEGIPINTDSMKCFMEYKKDKIECQLCSRIDDGIYSYCKYKAEEEHDVKIQLSQIQRDCKYHDTAWDEYEQFNSCHKNGRGYGRHADCCIPTLECKKYSK